MPPRPPPLACAPATLSFQCSMLDIPSSGPLHRLCPCLDPLNLSLSAGSLRRSQINGTSSRKPSGCSHAMVHPNFLVMNGLYQAMSSGPSSGEEFLEVGVVSLCREGSGTCSRDLCREGSGTCPRELVSFGAQGWPDCPHLLCY